MPVREGLETMHRTMESNKRAVQAMQASGIFTAEQLASEAGIDEEIASAFAAGEMREVDVLSAMKIHAVLRSFSLRWIILGEGKPTDSPYRLEPRERAIVDCFRDMTEGGKTRLERTAHRYRPTK